MAGILVTAATVPFASAEDVGAPAGMLAVPFLRIGLTSLVHRYDWLTTALNDWRGYRLRHYDSVGLPDWLADTQFLAGLITRIVIEDPEGPLPIRRSCTEFALLFRCLKDHALFLLWYLDFTSERLRNRWVWT